MKEMNEEYWLIVSLVSIINKRKLLNETFYLKI